MSDYDVIREALSSLGAQETVRSYMPRLAGKAADALERMREETEGLRYELEGYRIQPKVGIAQNGWSWSSIHYEEHADGCSRDDCLVMDMAAKGMEQEAHIANLIEEILRLSLRKTDTTDER